MKQSCSGKLSVSAAVLLLLASSAIRANDGAILVVSETGQGERRCHIDRTTPQPNGDTIYDLRDLATGKRFQVVDTRVIKTAGPLVVQTSLNIPSQRDAGMIAALAASPFTASANGQHVPTLAEQASLGNSTLPGPGLFRGWISSPARLRSCHSLILSPTPFHSFGAHPGS